MFAKDLKNWTAGIGSTIFACLSCAIVTLLAAGNVQAEQLPSRADAGISGVWWVRNPEAALRPVDGGEIPFTAAGKTLYAKQRLGLKEGTFEDRTWKYCLPSGVPRIATSAYPFQIVQTNGLVTFLYEENRTFRSIPIDEKHPAEVDDLDPYYMGHSVGRWEGDTLVVDTLGFNDETLLDATGLPHGEKLHVVERFRKTGGGKRLEVIVTIDDSEFFSKPWTTRRVYELRPDVHIEEYVCGEPKRDLREATKVPSVQPPGAAVAANQASKIPDLSNIWYHFWFEDPSRVMRTGEWPTLKPWAAAKAKEYSDATAAGKPLHTSTWQVCLPSGVPLVMSVPYPMQILQTPEQVIIIAMLDHEVRFIHMNESHPANLKPSWYGHSVGHYEGDTLVIETTGLNDKTSLQVNRYDVAPHTDALRVVERIRVIEGGNFLEDHIYVDDPKTLEKPYSYTLKYKKIRSMKILEEYACPQNNRDAMPVSETGPRPDFR